MSDWIDDFMTYTEGISSPEIYRQWSAIATVAGALERRVWAETARSQIYPNLFVLLVGVPGVGKSQAISHVEDLWRSTKRLFVAPNNVTKAALLDALQRADRKITTPDGFVQYHSMQIAADEFGVLVPQHDLEFLSTVAKIFDCPRVYSEERRHGNHKQLEIIHPQLTMLAGVQPGFMASLLPEEAWQQGFTARLIMVYSGSAIPTDLFGKQGSREGQFRALSEGLVKITRLMGVMSWEPDTARVLQAWVNEKCKPEPTHSKLVNYNVRRPFHIIKLCMISAASQGRMTITAFDLDRAREWILQAESVMGDIFREMVGRSDTQVLQELHYFMWQLWISGNKKPIHESRLIHFLQQRIPSEKVLRLIEIAERSNIIVRIAGTLNMYTPKPKHEHGVE